MQPPEIHSALRDARIAARYQPIVRLADRAAVAVEALARLWHPVHGLVGADRFVPQIELAGLSRVLTDLVAASIFADLAEADPAILDLTVGINIPLDLLLLPGTLDRLDAGRDAAGLAASRLAIELTESQPVENPARLGRTLERVRAAGYGVLIDDAGPAMTYVMSLLDLPFTGLKLDAGLVHASARDAEARRFADHVVAGAKRHGLAVTAEGVEDQAGWDHAVALGADQAQGYLSGSAMPAAALPGWRAVWDAGAAVRPARCAGHDR
ncbi:MAG: EAL domain-containing protein, partial [Rhodospirillales bacterium]|nr:EAL domain-containing protein [Rhodospirillales bacterium]